MTTYLRADWGAPTPADGYTLTGPLGHIFVHHTVGPTPGSPAAALAEVLNIYRQHTSPSSSDPSKPWNDIAYSWLVDDFGNAYEGRGWLRSQAAQPGWNSKGHSICWMGNAMTRQPSTKALAAIAQVIVDGQRAAAVTPTPTILGHRDVNPTACCGDLLYAQLGVIRAAVIDLPPATIEPPDTEDITMPTHLLRLPSGAVIAAFASGTVRTIGGAEYAFFADAKVPMLAVSDANEANQLTWQAHPFAIDVRRLADASIPTPAPIAVPA
jgi:hypothetical protein